MPLTRDPASRPPRARTPGPPVLAWLSLGLIVLAGLVLVAALAGTKPDASGQVDVLPVLGSSIERTLQDTVVAGLLAGLLAVLLAAVIRRARLRWLARRAKAVDVAEFTTSEEVPEDAARQLTLRFRERLSELHLAAPGPQPGASNASDFLQLIGSATQAHGTLGLVTALLSAAWPQHAYQVQGAFTRRDGDKSCGVTIQVLALPSTVSPPTVCWGLSFQEAVDHAANHAAAFILPRTRWVKHRPWAEWKGIALPPQLVDAYERGSVYTARRRYDEALREFYDALALDPKNLDVRLRIGFVHEKMGMPLDALATYHAISELADMGVGSRHTANIARYRLAVILGSGEELAREWCREDDATKRGRERAALREFMAPTLADLCQHWIDLTSAKTSEQLEELLRCPDVEHRELRLREVFQITALRELKRLCRRLRPMPLPDRERSLTRTAVKLSTKCVCVRLRQTVAALPANLSKDSIATDSLPELTEAGLRAAAKEAGLGSWPRPTWAERYCAASLFALGITCGAPQDEVDELSKAAVDELRKAVAAADTSYVASRRAWLVSEDPDLEGLRGTHAFEQFEATCFPGARALVHRPREAHAWERIEYVRRLVRTCAERREDLWRGRLNGTLDAGKPHAGWWDEEREAWSLIGRVADDCEHRETRLELIDALRGWAERHVWGRLPLDYPDYVDIAPAEPPSAGAMTDAKASVSSLSSWAETEMSRSAASPDLTNDEELRRACGERAQAWLGLRATVTRASPPPPADGGTDGTGNGAPTLSPPPSVPG